MITQCLRRILFVVSAFAAGLLFSSYLAMDAEASSAQAAHEEHVTTQESHDAHGDELPGEVPYDRPVKEIQNQIATMNEMNLFPCSDCHDADWEADPERRDLDEPHDEIPGKLMNHDEENRWCLSCHSAKKRDKLILQDGTLIEFKEYYRLCAQCHKRIYREWKMGVHGKRTGHWNEGEKEWMHCAQCHNPHNPPFMAIKPEPAPRKPLDIWVDTSVKKKPSPADTQH